MSLIAELEALLGKAHVLTGTDTAGYATDWTGKYAATPLAVLRPADRDQVSAILRLANATHTPVVPVAGRTGLAGGALADGALMLSVERLNTIQDINPAARTATVGAGVILSRLHDAAADHGLTFPMTFGARDSAMIGGLLATNAGGSNVLRYGNTRALCLGLEVVLADGRVMDAMGALHKDNTGYDLRDLMIGSEGTLGIITAAVLKLVPLPRAHATAMVALPDLGAALDLLNLLQQATGGAVEAFEYMPDTYMRRLATCRPDLRPPFEQTYPVAVMVEIGATAPRDAEPGPDGRLPLVALLEETLAAQMEAGTVLDAVIAQSQAQRAEMWLRRELAAEITFSRQPAVDNDIALPLDRVGTFLDRMETRLPQIDAGAETITVGHLGDGNLHYVVWPTRGDEAMKETIRTAVEDEVATLGGSFSAEHGIGVSKLSTMARRKDAVALDVMRAIKSALDPNAILNPGKVLPPNA
ncbi:FAD-binding oxidoreductase [Rhodovulum adriaticum]|uniref:FAD/FMN-containing dehydrogenase n=1 Tax=Rhodovulum adriaticum TaxID=35804 RepID=A0A4R2NK94_RHOAD|nr:FAD-binding oxidoreductase [Rhodovulum adriaticum]MBK1635564.1 FAD-binding oxidoreductase [Rhodovulum adriaticum]TCP21802.1 FAD/FMN-containing dehydrogenase [Rhodovulum adriaticum]